MSFTDPPPTLRSEVIAAELAAEVLERPSKLAQYERSLVAIIVVVARKRPGLATRAAAIVRGVLEDSSGELIDCEQTPSGHWRAA